MHTKRTQPALLGATLPTAPVLTPTKYYMPAPEPPSQKRQNRVLAQLLGLGVLMEVLFLALYPLLAHTTSVHDVTAQAVIGIFPGVPHLYWTTAFPALVQLLAGASVFNLSTSGGNANALLLLLSLAFFLMLVAARVGNRVIIKGRLSPGNMRTLFCTLIIFTAVFGLTYVCAPGGMTQTMFLYGLYARLVTVYHANPYVVPLTAFPHDILQQAILKGVQATVPPGPVWVDMSIPVALFARESVANIILGFRLVGLLAHLANAVLIWVILGKLKPERRFAATLLYAWNPLVLLLSVGGMHQDVVIVLFLLMGLFCFQRNIPVLAWVFVLLAALINPWVLVLLPLFFGLLSKSFRTMKPGPRVLWWLLVVWISVLLVVLAYAPYWQNWGIAGLLGSLKHTFLQESAINAVDAALLNLPIKLPPLLSWLIAPHHWTLFALVAVGCLLLLGIWLADTIELVALFSSWIFLALLVLLPTYWPWYMILPLTLALCSANYRTIVLATFLMVGALFSYYFWLWQPVWSAQALVSIALPLVTWGWLLFFSATWEMTHAKEASPSQVSAVQRAKGLSRPSWTSKHEWPSRPSWPVRRR